MSGAFRHDPPRPSAAWIERPRLLERLERRYELRAMLLVAPAGYGKTTLLSQAVEVASRDLSTADIWLQCEPADADAGVLAEAILRSAGLTPGEQRAETAAAAIADAALRFSPREVCIILDDVHRIADDSPGLALLDRLVGELPRNAHLLLSGRTVPPLRIARQRISGQVEVLTTDDLRYDDDERDRALGDAELGAAATWPAMTVLARQGADADGVPYLLEEVASALGAERLAVVAAVSTLRRVDDRIATVATGSPTTAAALLADLPLVQRADDGSFQLHDLWRQALVGAAGPDDAARAVLGRIAEETLAVASYVEAARQFATAGDVAGVRRAAFAMLAQPLTHLAAPDVRQMRRLCSEALAAGDPVLAMLEATVVEQRDERSSSEAFEAVALVARRAGDDAVEALAIQSAMNMRSILDPASIPDWLLERADALAADGLPMAEVAAASIRAHRARLSGDPETAVAYLTTLSGNPTPMAAPSQAFGFGDLGRPEDVPTSPDHDEATTTAARAGGQYLAQAIWLRGEVAPELALELGAGLAAAADEFRMAHVQVSTNAVLCLVALAAGDRDRAEVFRARASRWSKRTASGHVRAFAAVAEAASLLCHEGEDPAREAIRGVVEAMGTESSRWPPRPYLYALPTVYALAPSVRPLVDRCRFGPALGVAQQAGQALVALREHHDPSPAASLPWHRPWLLRAHVLPPHLGELAAAAAAAGHGEVGLVLQELPHLRDQLGPASRSAHAPTAAWARERVAQLPARPPYDLRVEVLGPMVLRRGETIVTEASWAKRERVRELLAVLLLTGRVSRAQVAELLWPGLPITKALANLRVNLAHLQKVLQPGRDDEKPWFVQASADGLWTAPTGILTDLDRFEQGAAEARRLDDSGQGTLAIETYRSVAELHRGELLQDLPDAAWADADRARVQALASTVFSRLGELLLARGEPEEAARWATRTLRTEPLHERAARLLARSLAGQDDRAGAARVLRSLLEQLGDERLAPERSTLDLAVTLGVSEVDGGR